MEIQILKDEKNELEIKLDNQTIAEIVRVYLNKDSNVKFSAWKKDHATETFTLKIVSEGKSAKKALEDAIEKIKKDLSKYAEEFKKAKF